ncbi:hypothetical protein COV53_02175 [Candidatus Gottesmanbacteria bacterium CG11_big_fil_rev_8_21_14_0_20_37_11]|uniref:Peptidase C-terminal archaeal/bacterial domain-containing protein n=2 Tax=Candidatus Gottesmaniibacteriota TaxID=1752720 RepID=A0A2M7RS89_9BACT|nr:MAG: hypothetical protein COX23_02275 [Candidatus Gottesmanbacteria bacterium CG23_combo_of_CG06-09_8_20_14_all_37_19]PIR08605.1 MAG: hypothetical protein COV53_02175 [Candidatus Gottesmanbacteria bacterium CG11_big_fil_rev_8_21_14_0_20_37_11]PIZ03181.1 MAG: hypothetical protein COY59_00905 [Candidatus Gottesmanbacteria bacterium CG_4_10_14_0_8_um_filter_37_24]HCX89973.1 hypothetical protein [Deltaproteobacteria bacterium]
MFPKLFAVVLLFALFLMPAPMAQAQSADCPVPPNTTWQTAIQLASSQTANLTMPGNSEGWYKFYARKGTVVTISANGNPGDPDLALYDEKGLPGNVSAASLPQSGTRISFTVPDTAWYWVQLTNHDPSAACVSMHISLTMQMRLHFPIIFK